MIITNIKELRQISEEVEPEEIEDIVKQLEEELSKHKTGIGLSAIQIGIPKRVAIIKIPNKEKIVLYNPKIIEKEIPFKTAESCLSLPGLCIWTKRFRSIVVENGDGQRYSVDDIEAICIQHEIDHMNGKLILGRKWKKRGRK